jgi:Protein of unknown function (DUF3224)
MVRAAGSFQVELAPQSSGAELSDASLGRLTIEKRFAGDLEGTGQGQMLTAMTPVEGSAGYVAIERVTGRLHGRRGSFVLQHRGVMDHGRQELQISVVPDSGTDELAGLTGAMRIEIEDGEHTYELDYALPGGP